MGFGGPDTHTLGGEKGWWWVTTSAHEFGVCYRASAAPNRERWKFRAFPNADDVA